MSKRYKALRRQRYYDRQMAGLIEAPEFEEDDQACWCGETKPYYAPLPSGCGGSGSLQCYCGGDFCVCHWHGEVECFGCEDCEESEDEFGHCIFEICEGDCDLDDGGDS